MDRRSFLLGLGTLTAGACALTPRIVRAAPRPVIESGFRLVIDPGHGGENAGCNGHGHDEKDLTLALAQTLAARVAELMPQAEILLTRESDETLHLTQRVAFANDCGADLFLSLHCNASPHGDQAGFETFILDVEASSQEAALTAMRENGETAGRRGAGAGDEVNAMLRELSLTHNRTHAAHYAKAIQREHARRFPGRVDRGVRQAAFDVLMGAQMPAVLHEVAFLDHPEDARLLVDSDGREEVVEAIARATLSYYNEIVRRSS